MFLESLFSGQGRSVGATAAVANVARVAVGGVDATFLVAANVLVTTATNHAFTVTCTYTDEGNTGRVLVLSFTLIAGGTLVTSVATAAGTVPYMGVPQLIRAKAGTFVTIESAAGGTYTTVVYNIDGRILALGA